MTPALKVTPNVPYGEFKIEVAKTQPLDNQTLSLIRTGKTQYVALCAQALEPSFKLPLLPSGRPVSLLLLLFFWFFVPGAFLVPPWPWILLGGQSFDRFVRLR